MEEIYLETISNIINNIENFEKIITSVHISDITFFATTLNIFKNLTIQPYENSLKMIGIQKNNLFNSAEKNNMNIIWSKNMLLKTLQTELTKKYLNIPSKNIFEDIFNTIPIAENVKKSRTNNLDFKKYKEIYFKLLHIFNTKKIKFIESDEEIFFRINFKTVILDYSKINKLCNFLEEQTSLKEIFILPEFNWENEFDENTKGIIIIFCFERK